MVKKDGGTIKNWQLHTLSCTPEYAKEVNPNLDIQTDKVYMFSGTIVDDPTGRWQPGHHMRSSVISRLDRENSIIETQNTIYKLEGEEGADCLPDLGDNINKIYY